MNKLDYEKWVKYICKECWYEWRIPAWISLEALQKEMQRNEKCALCWWINIIKEE